MKNLKTKIGTSLAAFAFFATIGLTSGDIFGLNSGRPLAEKENGVKGDPDVTKVVETLKKTKCIVGYATSDGKFIEFAYKEPTTKYDVITNSCHIKEKGYLKLQIYKLDKNREIRYNNYVVIKDYNLDNLDSRDVVSHVTKYYSAYFPELEDVDTAKFGELSSKTQQEIREKYNKIIREAPEKLLKEEEVSKQSYDRVERQKKQKLERDILDIIK